MLYEVHKKIAVWQPLRRKKISLTTCGFNHEVTLVIFLLFLDTLLIYTYVYMRLLSSWASHC